MELKDFYTLLLPAAGQHALFHVPTKKHVWVESIDDLVKKTELAHQWHSWYFATAAFAEPGARKQANVSAKRCLYLDIDCGAEKHERDPENTYPTAKDGVAAVIAARDAIGLSPTLIVSSGAGLHVYYAFDRDLSPAEWNPLAKALGAKAAAAGLKVDPSCTTDSARVLRPVGALHKNGKRVQVIYQGKTVDYDTAVTVLAPADETFRPDVGVSRRAKLDVNAMVAPAYEPAPVSGLKVAEKCAALRRVAQAGGDVPEPEWRAMIGVVKFCVEGVDLAHEWSRGHDSYDPDETQAKFDNYAGTGPTVCSTFARFNPKACAGCEFNGKITTPCQLGKLSVEAVEALPPEQKPAPAPKADTSTTPFSHIEFGPNFRVVQAGTSRWVVDGRRVVEVEGADGEKTKEVVWNRLMNNVCWIDNWTEAGERDGDGAVLSLRVFDHGMLKSFQLPSGITASQSDLLKWLAEKGVHTADAELKTRNMMSAYINAQVNDAKNAKPRRVIRDRFGLQFDGTDGNAPLVAAQGEYLIRPDGSIEKVVLAGKLAGHKGFFDIARMPASKNDRWGPEVWNAHIIPGAMKQVEFYRKYYSGTGRDNMQLALMLSMGSPLLVFTADAHLAPGRDLPALGLTVSLYSAGSGKGKSSLQEAAAAAYGNPTELVPQGGKQSGTLNYRSAMMTSLGTMPFFLDEVTSNGPQEVAELIDRIAGGKNKNRLNRNSTMQQAGSWAFTALVSTNVPQREMLSQWQISSDALQMRMIELTCEYADIGDGGHVSFKADRDELLFPNYGCLGACINYAIVRSGAETVRAMMQARFHEAAGLVPGSTQRERFLQRGMATALGAHDLLEKLGVSIFDRHTLIQTYTQVVKDTLSFTARMGRAPLDMFKAMISEMAPHIVVTQTERVKPGVIDRVLNERHVRQPIAGRRVVDGRYLYLSSEAMRKWATENQYSANELVRAATQAGVLRKQGSSVHGGYTLSRCLTTGTDFADVRAISYMVDEALLFREDNPIPSDNIIDLTKENRNAQALAARPGTSTAQV